MTGDTVPGRGIAGRAPWRYTAEVEAATRDVRDRIRGVDPRLRIAVFRPEIDAIRRLEAELNAHRVAHQLPEPEIYHRVRGHRRRSLALARVAARPTPRS